MNWPGVAISRVGYTVYFRMNKRAIIRWNFQQGKVQLYMSGGRGLQSQRRINQIAGTFSWPFRVHHEKGEWIVRVPGASRLFENGMVFDVL